MLNQTYFVMLLTGGGLFTFVLLLFAIIQQSSRTEWYWVGSSIALTGATALLALRGSIPVLLSIVVGNVVTVGGLMLVDAGYRVFQSRRIPVGIYVTVLTTLTILFLVFTYLFPSTPVRLVVVSLYAAAVLARISIRLFVGFEKIPRSLSVSLGTVYALTATFFLFRSVIRLFGPEFDPLRQGAGTPVTYVMYILGMGAWLGGSLGFIFMEKQALHRQVQDKLAEKELLLRELRHRVKNNLQVVYSLLYMQSATARSVELQNALTELRNRVRSIVSVHELLYRSESPAQILFTEYVKDFVRHVADSYGAGCEKIRTVVEDSEVVVGADVAVPLGLIINELVSNSFKHAFPGDRTGEIRVAMTREEDGSYKLILSDDGVGFHVPSSAAEGAQPDTESFLRDHASIGLKLVETLVGQIHGRYTLSGESGTTFTLFLPELSQ